MHFPLFILPFDHRSGFLKELLGKTYPLDEAGAAQAKELKKIIWEGFLLAKSEATTSGTLAILIDEEFGGDIIKDAKRMDVPVILSTEKSGSNDFDFIHGDNFGNALLEVQPAAAKALVQYHRGDEKKNEKTRKKLKVLSDFCHSHDLPFLLEVLTGGANAIDTATLLTEIEEAGIKPDIWKLEGTADPRDWKTVRQVTEVPIVVLGRAQSEADVEKWIVAGAASGEVSGIAVGRTIFLEPLKEYLQGTLMREEAAQMISERFLKFISLFEAHTP